MVLKGFNEHSVASAKIKQIHGLMIFSMPISHANRHGGDSKNGEELSYV